MKEIVNHIEEFFINDDKIVLEINYTERRGWQYKVLSGNTGGTGGSGGKFENLQEYVQECKKNQTYFYHFFKKGYKEAKESIKNL